MLNVALIGAGSIGRIHAANLSASERAQLSVVCDPNGNSATALAEPVAASVTTQVEDALASSPDAVIIASSTASHGDVAAACVAAKIPFLCEKPLAFDLPSAERIAADADAESLVTAMGLNRRFDYQYSGIRDAVQRGDIGSPEAVLITSRSEAPPTPEFIKTSGGLFGEKGSHFYDLCRWICGEDPEDVFAMGSVMVNPGFRDVGEVDTALVALKMPTGTICQLDFSWRAAYGQDERLEVNGARGMLQTRQAPDGAYMFQSAEGRTHPGVLASWRVRFEQTYRDELSAFLDAVSGATPDPRLATIADGVAAQRIAEAAKRSIASGQSVRF